MKCGCTSWKVCGFPVSACRSHWIALASSSTNRVSCASAFVFSLLRSYSATCSGRKKHAVALGEAGGQPGVELGGGERHQDAALDVEGDHAIEQQEVLALGDHLCAVVPGHEHRKLPQVCADKVPDALVGAGCQLEARFEPVVGLVGGDHQILLDRSAGHLTVGALPLVEGAHVGDHKTGGEDRLLDSVPDGVAGVMEHHGHPAARLEDAPVLGETSLHRMQIVRKRLALGSVDDRLG